jgi:ubiquinone/menaquinone biosynthesis C-methylase UbiE
MNHVLCDGGLCNRLNALLFALLLKQRFGGDWQISWPRNNWCDAAFERLFTCELAHDDHGIEHYRQHQSDYRLFMHENQGGFDAAHLTLNSALTSWADWQRVLADSQRDGVGIVYYNNLLPPFVEPGEVRAGLQLLGLNPDVARQALAFVAEHAIDTSVTGLHIRKTDFGSRVDDQALFREVAASTQRHFLCSDDAEVNQRFATLAHCAVFEKTAFPEKIDGQRDWLNWTTDQAGRNFPFNVQRGEQSVVEGLIDLLVLSCTRIRATSASTFPAMARLFQSAGFLQRHLKVQTVNAPLEARQFNLAEVDENEHLIPRPYGTLQSLNLDHLYRYAFAKGFCFNADVLDAAMGCGYSSLLLNCKSYTGVDIDPNMVAFANEVYLPMTKKGRYLQGSVLELPVPDHSIDTYISFETIEHIQPGEVAQYFAEVKRVLRPGGRFICSTPIYRGDKYGLLTRYHPFEFRYQQFEATLVNQGFVMQETLYQWPPHFTLEHVMPSFAQTQQPAPFLTICVAQVAG